VLERAARAGRLGVVGSWCPRESTVSRSARLIDDAMRNHQHRRDDAPSVLEGFTFHMLRHTAASQVAPADMDPADLTVRIWLQRSESAGLRVGNCERGP
jgi:integrase